ncbi:HIT family protein [Bacillus sp. B1-b2]|uniref:HIT family protein n=1 Tax=Bacillus sp. B1-b2 TaxID=2653201 RepID=UPI00126276B9|nr:HIT family protein [Bacillus sp. B1-b2]KAB7664313.1 HIT family protein [Bacillus sp. B1-b2]
MAVENCLICNRINKIKEGTNPYFVAELETGYVVIGDHQLFRGYTLFLCKHHETELHFLEEEYKNTYLKEMSKVAEAVYNAFHPDKLNYELLGNGDAHLHWHLFPRRESDGIYGPVWWANRELMSSDEVRPSEVELLAMKQKLEKELEKLIPLKKEA